LNITCITANHLLNAMTSLHVILSENCQRWLMSSKKYLLFGDTHCWMYSTEWQQRGLLNAYMLVWLQQKIQATDVDKLISAELPDPHTYPLLLSKSI